MMRHFLKIIMGTLLLMPVQGIAAEKTIEGCMPEMTVEKDSELLLRLPAIAGTGFQWKVLAPLTKLQDVSGDALEYLDDAEAEHRVGGARKQVLRYHALKQGREVLKLGYLRVFEKKAPAQECVVIVTVK